MVEQVTQTHTAEETQLKKKKKRGKKYIPAGRVYILTSSNNTLITVTDPMGNTISSSSAGARGFKGSRKSTPFAAQVAAEDAVRKAYEYGLRTAQVLVSGVGAGRESAIRALIGTGVKVSSIEDITPIPFNGCRPRKQRRV